jgi:hypothetical protein
MIIESLQIFSYQRIINMIKQKRKKRKLNTNNLNLRLILNNPIKNKIRYYKKESLFLSR